ncbi:MAG TPA: hypothetical protein VFG37_01045 [Planctomycetota bacterium]|nr:hypothetical protein [Planctomycetota bacterium]
METAFERTRDFVRVRLEFLRAQFDETERKWESRKNPLRELRSWCCFDAFEFDLNPRNAVNDIMRD